MKTGTKITIGILSAIALGTALYFFVFKKKADDKTDTSSADDETKTLPPKSDMIEQIKSASYSKSDTQEDRDNIQSALEKMSDSELYDTYLFSIAFQKNIPLTDSQKKSMEDISKKYNIFT